MSGPWTREEVEATVSDYLHMLTQELAGQSYSKTEHRRALQRRLDNRPEGAIERKHQNISAILREFGCPWINGYKPLSNYQHLLWEVVSQQVASNALFDQVALKAAEQPAAAPIISDFEQLVVAPPSISQSAKEVRREYAANRTGVKRDYLEREARNASLGRAGEEFVADYERMRLRAAGKQSLS